MLDPSHGKLSLRRQCALLGVARSGLYRQRRPANDNDLAVMRRLDELFTAWPFFGSRRMVAMLRAEGHRTPMTVWREGVTGELQDKAVDMTLRLGQRCRVAHIPTATATTAMRSLRT